MNEDQTDTAADTQAADTAQQPQAPQPEPPDTDPAQNDPNAAEPTAQAPTVVANVIEVERARLLTEIDASEPMHDVQVAEGAIEHFMDDSQALGRRVMKIVADAAGMLRKLHLPNFGE